MGVETPDSRAARRNAGILSAPGKPHAIPTMAIGCRGTVFCYGVLTRLLMSRSSIGKGTGFVN